MSRCIVKSATFNPVLGVSNQMGVVVVLMLRRLAVRLRERTLRWRWTCLGWEANRTDR